MMYVVRGKEVDPKYSPIDRKLMEYSEKLNRAISFTMYDCTFCGQRERGITNVVDGTFKCRICLLKEEAQRLNNDPDMIKQEKIWNMRMAIRRHKENEVQWTDQIR
jgi:hypothetical protein